MRGDTVHGQNPAPPKKPWLKPVVCICRGRTYFLGDDFPVNTDKEWFQPWFQRCGKDISSRFCPAGSVVRGCGGRTWPPRKPRRSRRPWRRVRRRSWLRRCRPETGRGTRGFVGTGPHPAAPKQWFHVVPPLTTPAKGGTWNKRTHVHLAPSTFPLGFRLFDQTAS